MITHRAHFLLRTLRIMANKFIDKTIPNPKATKNQRLVELLAPLFVAHCLAYIVSIDHRQTLEGLRNKMLVDALFKLIAVRFYFDKESKWYKAINLVSLLLPFYFCSTSKRVWDSMDDTEKSLSFLSKHTSHVQKLWNSQANFHNVIAEGLSETALYIIIDDYIMANIPIPRWLQSTVVQVQEDGFPI